ncbi:MAG: hypothetical protein K6A23_06145 [Butyrivibrio sp.]|nr:hypothetical protein [Butyrivibrio sp.]
MRTSVQLGWISDAINYIFDKLLNPMFSFFSDLISDGLTWLFNGPVGSVLMKFVEVCVKLASGMIMLILSRLFYRIEVALLALVDMMQNIFNVLAGTTKVTDNATGQTGSLLSVIATKPFVVNTMFLVIAVSFILCFVFAVIATIKSIGDMGGPRSQSVGHVLRQTAKALFRMILAPTMGIFLIVLGDAVMSSMTAAMTQDNNVTIARSIFVITTLDALDDTLGAVDKDGNMVKDSSLLGYNYSTRPEYLASHPGSCSDYGLMDKFRQPFYNGTKDYTRAAEVEPTFSLLHIDYTVGILCALLFIFLLGSALFVLVSRIFDVIVLLLIEPFFIASMPLDDGEHFKKWEDMFIAKLFSGYGMIVAMYLYLLVTSLVFGGKFSFTPRDGLGDIMMDMLMRIILLVGGATTVMSAGPLITSILNSVAAGEEARSMGAGTAFTGTLMSTAFKPVTYGVDKLSSKAAEKIFADMSDTSKQSRSDDNKFTGQKSEKDNSNVPSSGSSKGSSGSSDDGLDHYRESDLNELDKK